MLGLILIYFIGKKFYDLANQYQQNKWLYAILSIVVYYASGAVFGVILGVLDALLMWGIDWDNNFGINLLGIPIGLLAVYGFYLLLASKWRKIVKIVKSEIDDIGKSSDNDIQNPTLQ